MAMPGEGFRCRNVGNRKQAGVAIVAEKSSLPIKPVSNAPDLSGQGNGRARFQRLLKRVLAQHKARHTMRTIYNSVSGELGLSYAQFTRLLNEQLGKTDGPKPLKRAGQRGDADPVAKPATAEPDASVEGQQGTRNPGSEGRKRVGRITGTAGKRREDYI